MNTLKELIIHFILPPGLFIILLTWSGLFLVYRGYRKSGIFNLAVGFLLWLISIAPVSDKMMNSLESEFQIPDNPKGDSIILLGGGSIDKVPDLTGTGVLSGIMLSRVVTAVRLQKKLNVPIIVSAGWDDKNRTAEAYIVRRFLIDLGTADSKIIIEDRSRNTIENARYSKEICKEFGFKKPILLTSAYHLKRSMIAFKKVGMTAIPFPASFKTDKFRIYRWQSVLPSAGNLNRVSTVLREYIGILFYNLAY
jgi:uncharacterized SAM-binding protein YcdF (DUF218 family)